MSHNNYTSRPIVLCLSGHAPSGGAGIQADIEAILAQNCHAAPAVTALTVQNTIDVIDFKILDRVWVLSQANTILTDMPVSAIKLGMLGSIEMVDTIIEIIHKNTRLPIICDPILRAGGGGTLGKEDIAQALREKLMPLVTIMTPNLPEARILAELPEGSADECAEKLLVHCKYLLIKGGHESASIISNRLYSQKGEQHVFTSQRLPGSFHGSGCTLASALSARLALGEELVSAVETALNYTWRTLRDADILGHGQYIPRRLPLDFCS